MTDRRYSIIPAGAVTDTRLEGRDLQVLCFLGTHTDKLGWCWLSHGRMAEKLLCSRSSVQRSLARLVDAGWVQIKPSSDGVRSHASHSYRVIMDRDDPTLHPSEYPVDGSEEGERCPPVHTPVHPRVEVPIHARAPDPPEVPTHAWAHNDQDSGGSSGGSARARGGSISEEAHALASEIASIAGHDPEFLPPRWMSDGPAMRVQMMLDRGWQPAMLRETAKAIVAAKRDGPPETIRYFEKPFARAHARQSDPVPLPTITDHPSQPEPLHAGKTPAAQGWQHSRDRFRGALGQLRNAIDGAAPNQGGATGQPPVRSIAAAGRGRS